MTMLIQWLFVFQIYGKFHYTNSTTPNESVCKTNQLINYMKEKKKYTIITIGIMKLKIT